MTRETLSVLSEKVGEEEDPEVLLKLVEDLKSSPVYIRLMELGKSDPTLSDLMSNMSCHGGCDDGKCQGCC